MCIKFFTEIMHLDFEKWPKYPEAVRCLNTIRPTGLQTKMKVIQSCPTLWPHGLYNPWNPPGQNTWVCSLSLLWGIFPTQGSKPRSCALQVWILYQLSQQGSPRILECVACPFSSGSSWPRNQTRVSCTTGRFLTSWATKEALHIYKGIPYNYY